MLNIYKDGDSIQLQTKVINITNSASFLFNFLHADFWVAELQVMLNDQVLHWHPGNFCGFRIERSQP